MLTKIVALVSIAASARAQLAYTVELLPSPPGTTSQVNDVGGLGAVGAAYHPSGTIEAILWSGGVGVTLPAPQIGPLSTVYAFGVSSTHVVGFAHDSTYTVMVAIRWTGGVPAVLPTPPGTSWAVAGDVADDGVVIGVYFPASGGPPHACRWSSSDVFQALPEPVGAVESTTVSIRADGTILGRFGDAQGDHGTCAWNQAGQLSVLVPPGPGIVPRVMAADGSVYGSIDNPTSTPFRAAGGAITVLPTLTWQGSPMSHGGILDAGSSGRAVGVSGNSLVTNRACLWIGSNVIDLQGLVVGGSNWPLEQAEGIDESGRICCNSYRSGLKAFLLHPAGAWSYCTAGTTTNGCVPSIGSTGAPRVGQTSGFVITVVGVEAQRAGMLFYGIGDSGFTPTPWAVGSTSFLCVKAPTQRTTTQFTGGSLGQCDGALTLDWLAYMSANPGALGQPFAAGQTFHAQGWFRDPPAAKATNSSDALRWVVGP